MCYTTDSQVNIMTELITTDALGYRADCNNIPVRYIQYILLCLHIGIVNINISFANNCYFDLCLLKLW